MSEELTRATLRGATLIVSAQGLSRLVTFVGNVLLVRSMNNDAKPLGVSSTQLHLLYVAALALTRDGVRRACLRELPANVKLDDRKGWEVGASLSRAYSLVGLMLISPIVFFNFWTNPPAEIDNNEYRTSLILVLIGTSLELASEPMYIVAQNCAMYKLRSSVEAASALSRAFVGLTASFGFGCKLSAFAWGYCATGIAIFASLFVGLARASGEGARFPLRVLFGGFPTFQTGDDVGKFTFLTTIQSGWKLGLSEGEKIVMIAMGTVASDRGAYAMAANLGSLAARLLLQPSEEAAFTLFGKLKHNVSLSMLLSVLTRAAVVFALVFACFGTQYTHLLVLILYGRGWADSTETPYLLSWYCVFIAVCGVNGITEAFVQAVADDVQTKRFNFWLLACSLIFVVLSSLFLPVMGTSALIAANCLVMSVRIARNVRFALDYVNGDARALHFLPGWRTLLMFLVSLSVTWFSKHLVYSDGQELLRTCSHVALGGVLMVTTLFTVYLEDQELVRTLTGQDKPQDKTE